jgi:polyisoprenoid-binding protein YceI
MMEVMVMRTRKHLGFAGVAVGLLSLSAVAYAGLSSPTDAHVGFLASGPAGMKIEGTTTDLKVSDDGTNVVVEVPLANLSTGIALRDHHMKEKYLEVPKYPSATLTIARAALKFPASGDHVAADVPGSLKLHGQTKPISIHYDAKGDGGGFSTQGKFRVNMGDFGISVPSYLGVTVKPEVDVSASFHVAGT